MILSTKQKMFLAQIAYKAVKSFRLTTGQGERADVERNGIRWALDLREGIDLSIYLFGAFEPATVAAYRRLLAPNDIVIDAGANMGAHTLNLARCVAPSGRVLAFEPTTAAFARLRRNIELNPLLARNIVAHHAMLVANADQAVEPFIYSSWPIDGTTAPDAHPLHRGIPVSTSGATAVTLDNVTKDLAPIKLIKIDVDGHELEVLRGATELLRRDRPMIVMEFAPYTITERGQNPQELYDLLRGAGYRLFDLKLRSLEDAQGRMPAIRPGSGINVVAKADAGR